MPATISVMYRFSADISELNLPKACKMSFPNGKDDLMNFEVTVKPDEGYYKYIFLLIYMIVVLF